MIWKIFAIINVIGALYGFYYYSDQLANASPLFWVFIPDCPLYVLGFAVCCILMLKNMRIPWFEALVATGTFKYGLWTVIVVPLFSEFFLSGAYPILWVAHIGMTLESLFLFRKIRKRWFFGIAGWFILNDVMDYFFGTLPYLPNSSHNTFLLAYSLSISILLPLFLLITKSNKLGKKY